MIDLINALALNFSDIAILVIMATTLAVFGTFIAWGTNWLWFRRWPEHSAFDHKLADTAHTSLLGLAAFVLALMISNSLVSLGQAEMTVRQEGVSIYRLTRELESLGPSGNPAKAALAAYAHNVAGEEWKLLATSSGVLSSDAQRDLDTLWTRLRALQMMLDPNDPRRGDLTHFALEIESFRQSRLADSTSNIPNVFWSVLLIFVAAASFLAGRQTPRRFGLFVNMLHMAALGLAIGLVIILTDPFRGQTSIDPTIISSALGP